MKTPIIAVLTIIAGIGVGGGAAFGTDLIMRRAATVQTNVDELPTFVATGPILSPLVFPDGRLAGYVSFEAQLQVAPDKAAFVTDRLPLLLHAVNMRTFRTPMTSGPDGMLPDLAVFRQVLTAACAEAFGPGVIKIVAITQATPA
jgi:hypothetical protein